jgi:lysophospholipid acyltransferase (LPLAT)-like uncharacterized protein
MERSLLSEKRRPVYAFWHGKMLALAHEYRGRGAVVLISQNRDGEIIASIVERMGYGTVRGSSSKGGRSAVEDMVDRSLSGRSVAVTPDGPRGPFEVMQPGLLVIGQRSRAPVLCLGVAAHPSTRMRSWDGFLVPHPFARCVVSVAPPFRVPADLSPDDVTQRAMPAVTRYLKANDDHAHRQLLRWVSGDTQLVSFDGPLPEGMEPVGGADDRGEEARETPL